MNKSILPKIEKTIQLFWERKMSIDNANRVAFLIVALSAFISKELQARPAGTIAQPTELASDTTGGQEPKSTTLIDAVVSNPIGHQKLEDSVIIAGKYESRAPGGVERAKNIIIGDTAVVRDSSMSLSLGGEIWGKSGASLQRANMAIGTNTTVGDNVKVVNQAIAIGAGDRMRPGNQLNASWEEVKEGNGFGAWAKGDQSIALGGNTVAYGDASIAIGGDDINQAIDKRVSFINSKGESQTETLKDAFKDLTGITLEKGNAYKGHRDYKPYPTTAANNLAVAIGTQAQSEDMSIAMGTHARAQKINAVALGAGATASYDNSVAIGGGSKTDKAGTAQTEMTLNGITFQWAGGDKVVEGDIVSFGREGFERQLKNVAPGEVSEVSTDAINGSQLFEVVNKVTGKLDGGLRFKGDDNNILTKTLGSQLNIVGGAEPNTLTPNNIGVNSNTSGDLVIQLSKDIRDISSVTLIDGNGKEVKLTATQEGLSIGGNKIVNVAAGEADTDAVNVSQLKESQQDVKDTLTQHASAIQNNSQRIDELGNKMNSGLANAAAMATIEFQEIGINQAVVAAGVGTFNGHQAVAVGMETAPTENIRVNVKASVAPRGRSGVNTMAGVGASYKFNWK